ncbi:hypothetical protein ON010_g11037 [Phytophthora cinnamomi]|nr:hypothetical protein ON010_g11037 [Phytophthora cinnamomi]
MEEVRGKDSKTSQRELETEGLRGRWGVARRKAAPFENLLDGAREDCRCFRGRTGHQLWLLLAPAMRNRLDCDAPDRNSRRLEILGDEVRASQIGTPAQRSQHTLYELFGASSDSAVALSQEAVPRAFDLSPSVLQSPELRNATTNLQLLSEASGIESEVEPGDATVAPSRRVLRPRVQLKNDINFVPEDESMSAYESFSSGESDGEDAVDDADGYDGSRVSSDDEDTVSGDDAVKMDEAFIESLQIGKDSLSKRDIEQRTTALRAMKWTSVSSVFEDSATAYSGLHMEDARPVAELRELWRSPLLTFFYFMPKSLGTGHRARETLAQIRRRLKAKPAYKTHEILHIIGLLVALAWSLRAVLSVDDGVLPSTSKRNTTRMFMPDKPHRHGSKMFEMYAGKRSSSGGGASSFDHKTGAAAVVRNLKIGLDTDTRLPWHLDVVDRFYSSILVGIELLAMSVYVVGTIMTDRLGFDKTIVEKRKSRPASIPRGTFTFSHAVAVPNMVAFHWWDRTLVHYLCTGSTMTASTISRNVKRLGPIMVPFLAAVKDY